MSPIWLEVRNGCFSKGFKQESQEVFGSEDRFLSRRWQKFLRELVIFYPKHIEKEDRHFFLPCMNYFTDEQKDHMLREEWEFDKDFIHEKYKDVVAVAERSLEP